MPEDAARARCAPARDPSPCEFAGRVYGVLAHRKPNSPQRPGRFPLLPRSVDNNACSLSSSLKLPPRTARPTVAARAAQSAHGLTYPGAYQSRAYSVRFPARLSWFHRPAPSCAVPTRGNVRRCVGAQPLSTVAARAVRVEAEVDRVLVGRSGNRGSPGELALLAAAGRRVSPLRVAREESVVPDAERVRLLPGHAVDRKALLAPRRWRPRRVVHRKGPIAAIEVGVGGRNQVVVRHQPAGLVAAGRTAACESPAAVYVHVFASARRREIARVPRAAELAEAADGHFILVEPEAADARRVGLAGRAGTCVRVRPVVGAGRDFEARATTLARLSAVGHPRTPRLAARRLGTGIGGVSPASRTKKSRRSRSRPGGPSRRRRCSRRPHRSTNHRRSTTSPSPQRRSNLPRSCRSGLRRPMPVGRRRHRGRCGHRSPGRARGARWEAPYRASSHSPPAIVPNCSSIHGERFPAICSSLPASRTIS